MVVAALQPTTAPSSTAESPTTPSSPTTVGSPSSLEKLRAALPSPLRGQVESGRTLIRKRSEAPPQATLPTSVAALDRLLDGGLPRGRLVELIGYRSSGRFSLTLAILRAATAAGEAAALIDLGDNLDPQSAAAIGVDLERLLWVRPEHIQQALVSGEMLLASGFPLVVLEVGPPPVAGGRNVEAAWLRMSRAAAVHQGALLVSVPYRMSGTAAAVVLRARKRRTLWQRGARQTPDLLSGLSTHLLLEKVRGRKEGGGATVEMRAAC